MTTDNIVSTLTSKWLPLAHEQFFTAQRAPDMWFGDELPPTLQAELRSPAVTQAKLMLTYQLQQQLALGERQQAARHETARRRRAVLHVGKRAK